MHWEQDSLGKFFLMRVQEVPNICNGWLAAILSWYHVCSGLMEISNCSSVSPIATDQSSPPPRQMNIDKAKAGPVVSDRVSCSLVLPHWEGEQVEAGLVRVFPDVELEKSFNGKLALSPDVVVGADLEGEPALVVGSQVQDHRDH